MRYLLDVHIEKNELIMSKLIREATNASEDELGRLDWQIRNADIDVMMSDLVAVAVYTPTMEGFADKYTNGVAIYDGEDMMDNLQKIMILSEANRHNFVGWNIKTFTIPVLYRAFILNGADTSILDNLFDTYPFDNSRTTDLSNIYSFNGQMSTVRARNRYTLEETAYSYGHMEALDELGANRSSEILLRKRIELQKYLFNLKGLSWT